jgi:F-type H+-transporting ATPase subunit delta
MNLNCVARPYAKAAFEFALAEQQTQQWFDCLQQLAQLSQQAEVIALVASPNVAEKEVAAVLIDLLSVSNENQANFIRLLAQYKRLEALAEIFSEFEMLKEEHEKKMQVQVISAKELSDAQLAELTTALSKKFGNDVSIHSQVDENLLGGAIIKAGDLVIDGSIAGRIEKLREHLKGEQL